MTHDDPLLTGKIAWAHIKEFPDYYTRLERMETEAKTRLGWTLTSHFPAAVRNDPSWRRRREKSGSTGKGMMA